MRDIKRQVPFNQSYIKETKKLTPAFDQGTISMTSMETLSNEIFYEIFDYLNGTDIYHAFSNLNHRFQQLLYSSSFLFKLKLHYSTNNEIFLNAYKQIILHHPHQIFSIHLSMSAHNSQLISTFPIDSSFNRLESLVLDDIEPDILILLLPTLICLPRLFSLTIDTWYALKELNVIYRLVFALPKLRYTRCSASESEEFDITVSLPLVTNKQFSTIEYLVIDHGCTFKELFTIISYTPQLRHLRFHHLSDNDSSIRALSPIILTDLVDISMYSHYVTFDEFEMFIRKIECKLKVLRVTNLCEDITYLDANRWERFILKYLTQLEKFYLHYHVHIPDEDESPIYYGEPNQFISSFWIKRQWIFDVDIDFDSIIYSIRPYKKKWYEYGQVNSSNQLSKSVQLTFTNDSSDEGLHVFNMSIIHILTVVQTYHLFIFDNIFAGRLCEVLFSFVELDSLQIWSLSLSQPRRLSEREAFVFALISKKNQIRKVNLEKMTDVEEVNFLIELCPRMTYLKVNCIKNIDVELFVRGVLMKIMNKCNHHLGLLCFRVPVADDEMVQKLEKMINSEKLLLDYTIERIVDDIYLQWK